MITISTDFEDAKEEFIRFIRAIEFKFDIKDKDDFENELLKLIREGSNEKIGIDVDEFENSFFEVIRKHSSLSLEDNIKKIKEELEIIKEESNGT